MQQTTHQTEWHRLDNMEKTIQCGEENIIDVNDEIHKNCLLK